MNYRFILTSIKDKLNITSFRQIVITEPCTYASDVITCQIDGLEILLSKHQLGIDGEQNVDHVPSMLKGTYTYDPKIDYFFKDATPIDREEKNQVLYVTEEMIYIATDQFILTPLNIKKIPELKVGFHYWDSVQCKSMAHFTDSAQAKYLFVAFSNQPYLIQEYNQHQAHFCKNESYFKAMLGTYVDTAPLQRFIQSTFNSNLSILIPNKPIQHSGFMPKNALSCLYDSSCGINIVFDKNNPTMHQSQWQVLANKTPIWFDRACLVDNFELPETTFLNAIEINHQGIIFFKLDPSFTERLLKFNGLNAITYTRNALTNTIVVNPGNDPIHFSEHEYDFSKAIMNLIIKTPSTHVSSTVRELMYALSNFCALHNSQSANTAILMHRGTCFYPSTLLTPPKALALFEIFEDDGALYLGDHAKKIAYNITQDRHYPRQTGVYYARHVEPKEAIYFRLGTLPPNLTHNLIYFCLFNYFDRASISFKGKSKPDRLNISVTRDENGLLLNFPSLDIDAPGLEYIYFPINNEDIKTLYLACKNIPCLKTIFEMLLSLYEDSKDFHELHYTLNWNEEKGAIVSDIPTLPISGDAFYQTPTTHTHIKDPAITPTSKSSQPPSMLPHAILPSAVVLSAIFVGTGVISMPMFTIALKTASLLGALALQLAIYQTQSRAKPYQGFFRNLLMHHDNITAFGLMVITCCFITNPLAALITTASIMTLAPLISVESHVKYGLFSDKNNPTDEFVFTDWSWISSIMSAYG